MKLFAVNLCLFRWILGMRAMDGNHITSMTQIITMIVVRAPLPDQEAELVLHFHIIFCKDHCHLLIGVSFWPRFLI